MDSSPDHGARVSALEFAETFHKIPALVAYRVRCGKHRCRCADGALHGPYAFLRWRDGAKQRRRFVTAADVPAVRAVIERRRGRDRAERRESARALAQLRGWKRWLTELEANPCP